MSLENIRSFVAVDIEDQSVLEKIVDAQRLLAETGGDLNLVAPENIHITLSFLGETPISMIEEVCKELKKLEFHSFDVEFRGLGSFPNLHRISVVWIGIRKGVNELNEYLSQIAPDLRSIGFRLDKRGFSPHVTIARVKSGRNRDSLVRIIQDMRDMDFGTMKADSVRLKKSVLCPKGPIYSTIFEVKAI